MHRNKLKFRFALLRLSATLVESAWRYGLFVASIGLLISISAGASAKFVPFAFPAFWIASAMGIRAVWKGYSAHYCAILRREWAGKVREMLGTCEEMSMELHRHAAAPDLSDALRDVVKQRSAQLAEIRRKVMEWYDQSIVEAARVMQDVGRGSGVATMLKKIGRSKVGFPSDGPFWQSLPRIWELFSFILPPKARRECFEPAFNDLLEDYVRIRKFRGRWAGAWLAFAFSVRTLIMLLDCFRVLIQGGTGKILLGLLPDSIRDWWRRQ